MAPSGHKMMVLGYWPHNLKCVKAFLKEAVNLREVPLDHTSSVRNLFHSLLVGQHKGCSVKEPVKSRPQPSSFLCLFSSAPTYENGFKAHVPVPLASSSVITALERKFPTFRPDERLSTFATLQLRSEGIGRSNRRKALEALGFPQTF